jgi:hypothetical protein
MGTVMVVGVEPVGKCGQAGLVAGVGHGIGPLAVKGLVEALHLAVGAGPIRAGPLVDDAGRGQQLPESAGAGAGAIVGHDPLDGDSKPGEPGQRPAGEANRSLAALVGMDLQVGHPRAVVHRHMQEVIAHTVASITVTARPAMHPMPAAIGDPALLLDVDVDQLPGPLALVAHHLAGGSVQLPQPRELLAAQDRMHRRRRLPQHPADAVRPHPAAYAAGNDRLFPCCRQPPWAATRPRGPVGQILLTFGAPAPQPLVGRGR